ncbi:MAG: sugar ABC transporter ATP-binding protein [Synergistaceae bacterium]|jgi:ABC-type sugar transport system ATPase subunit|nr:sugar ABC transporter ATP-binding protein [Synergistaceae bacterium]
MAEYILEVNGIVKTFPGVRALGGVNLKVRAGEVHAVVGENGAGKSTLMLILGGIYRPDAGEILIDGEKVQFDSAHDANMKGISVVYQEFSLAPNLSVAENIFANRQPLKGVGMIDWKDLRKRAEEMLRLAEMERMHPDTLVKDLSVANQQVVEILKAMSFEPKVLILDEPTSSLTETEVKILFKNIKVLKERGVAILYISHHLSELFEIADSVTVLRDGEYVCDAAIKDIDEDFLITKMVGRKIENIYGRRGENDVIGGHFFEVKNLTQNGAFTDVSFHINKGEIVGFAGLVGAGRTEVGRAIFGAPPADRGEVTLEGRDARAKNPHQAIAMNIGYMSEDRKGQGLYINFNIVSNLIANRLGDFSENGFIVEAKTRENALACVNDFRIVTPGIEQTVGNLSGGNQQKVLLASWFGIKPKALIVDEPTRGVDVGARSEIYDLLRALAKNGAAIMMISSDLPEILGISDRIIVMREGRISGELSASEATEDKVVALAAGIGT